MIDDLDIPDDATGVDDAQAAYRDTFLRHLMRDMSGRLHQHKGQPAPRCLDLGCGDGRLTALLRVHGFSPVGLDLSGEQVALAQRAHPGVAFAQGDAHDLAYADNAFDAVVVLGLIQSLADWKMALAEVMRVLKPGGVAVIETERAFPLWENMLKTGAGLLRQQLAAGEAWEILCGHLQGAERPLAEGPRKFARRQLLDWVVALPARYVVVHDPRRHRVLHDAIWAVTLAKRSPGDPVEAPPVLTECVNCRRYGVVHMRGGGTLWMS